MLRGAVVVMGLIGLRGLRGLRGLKALGSIGLGFRDLGFRFSQLSKQP